MQIFDFLQIPRSLYMINASFMRLVNGLEIEPLPIPIPPLHLCCVFGRLMEVNQYIVGHSDCTRILQAKRYAIVLCWLTPHASSFLLLISHMDGMRLLLLSILQVRLTCVKRSLACILEYCKADACSWVLANIQLLTTKLMMNVPIIAVFSQSVLSAVTEACQSSQVHFLSRHLCPDPDYQAWYEETCTISL